MGLFKTKTAVIGMAAVFAVSSLFADQVVDNKFDDNENEFEQYWYYVDDNSGTGPYDRPQYEPESQPTVLHLGDVDSIPRESSPDDPAMVADYEGHMILGNEDNKNCITLPFTLGDRYEVFPEGVTYSYYMYPACGVGTMLAPDGKSVDLTGVTDIKFSLKSRVEGQGLTVKFKIQTIDLDTFSTKAYGEEPEGGEFAYFETATHCEVDEGWTDFTIPCSTLVQPSWVDEDDHPKAYKDSLDLSIVTKLMWEVVASSEDDNGLSDTLDIADVELIGDYEFVSPSLFLETESTPPTGNCLFSDFEASEANPLGYWWYAYNDAEIGGSSSVDPDFATLNTETGLLNLEISDETGYGYSGKGAALMYTLGDAVMQGSNSVKGFVGIGANLYDSTDAEYWDATADGAEGIYFEYAASGLDVTLELSDYHDVGDYLEPDRRDSRGSGIVHYRNFPATDGEWRRVFIPFDSLIVHEEWEGYTEIPLDLTQLAKVQWKVQGAEGTQGSFAIDNVAFPGVDDWEPLSVLMNRSNAMKAAGFDAMFNNGNIQVKLNNPAYTSGTVDLVNVKGAVVRSASIARGTDFATLSAKNLSAGMYLVNLRAVDAKGNAIRKQTRINILQ